MGLMGVLRFMRVVVIGLVVVVIGLVGLMTGLQKMAALVEMRLMRCVL
jgi:hypothetical protein